MTFFQLPSFCFSEKLPVQPGYTTLINDFSHLSMPSIFNRADGLYRAAVFCASFIGSLCRRPACFQVFFTTPVAVDREIPSTDAVAQYPILFQDIGIILVFAVFAANFAPKIALIPTFIHEVQLLFAKKFFRLDPFIPLAS